MNIKDRISVKTSYKAIIATLGLCAVIYLYYLGGSYIQLAAIALFFGVLFLWTETIESFADFHFKREKWPLNVVVGVIIGLAMFVIYVVYKRLDLSHIEFNVSIFAAVTMVAAAEEFFFRGYLQGKLSKDYNVVVRIAIVTVLFGLYKVAVFSTMQSFISLAEIVVISCLGSVILSIQMEKMQNLLAPVISHALWDNLVYSNMSSVPSWITTSPQWTDTLYGYIHRFAGFFCSQSDLQTYVVAGKEFVTCSGCTGIYLGVFFAFFLYEKKLFEKLHTKKFYIPALLPMIFMFFGLNILTWVGILDPYTLSAPHLQIINYCYTIFGLVLGFSGSVLLVNVIREQSEAWEKRMEDWLRDYEYIVIPALLLAFLSNPLSNPQLTALIFFSILVAVGILTVVVFVPILFISGIKG
jgi:membrane protease YdiL (CAAX protease family)